MAQESLKTAQQAFIVAHTFGGPGSHGPWPTYPPFWGEIEANIIGICEV